jgi:ABC-type nitrate/sulfonate/bicarbonate transport system ATPase subunit
MRRSLSDRIAIRAPRPGRVEEIKVVQFERPRDPTNPAMVRLAAEVKIWMRQQAFAAPVDAPEKSGQSQLNRRFQRTP